MPGCHATRRFTGRAFPRAAAAILAVALSLAGCANRLMLDPAEARRRLAEDPVDPARHGHAPETVYAAAPGGGRLRGWLFESPGDRGVVLAGGGASNGMPQAYDYYRFLVGRGFRVLFVGYRGFDDNPGEARLQSLPEDWQAFAAFARRRYPEEPLAFVGLSVGGTAALCAAAREPDLAGLVLDGVADLHCLPYARTWRRWWLYPFLPVLLPFAAAVSADVPASLDAGACAAGARAPALFVHHPRDELIPFRHGTAIFLRYGGAKDFFVSALEEHRHFHVILADDPEAQARALEFIGRVLGPDTPPRS